MAEDEGNSNKFSKNISLGGRPPVFDNPNQLEEKCEEYFYQCIDIKEKPTITGLTLFVGFCSRSSWDDYAKRDGFSYIVKRAKLTVENSYETSATSFDIFALKNMGWKDKTETDLTTNGENLNQPTTIVFKKFNESDTNSG